MGLTPYSAYLNPDYLSIMNVPKDTISLHKAVLRTGKLVLIAHGSPDDITKTKDILNRTKTETSAYHQTDHGR
jgi:hypothetical protein